MNTPKFNLAVQYAVIYKENGLIAEFQRTPKGTMKLHNHLKTATNAWRKLGGASNGFDNKNGWFITTTVALANAKWA